MRGLWRRLLEIVGRDRLDREAAAEMTAHIEMLAAHKVAGGMDEREAHRVARVELGNIQRAREQIREERTGFALEQVWRELAHAARVLRRSPGLTALSIATMGVGIGVSAILFALVNGIVLSPLRYPAPDRLVRIFDSNQTAGVDRTGVATGNIDDWRRGASSFAGIAAYYTMGRTVSVDGNAEALLTAQVTDDFFAVVGVSPALGRTFTSEEVRSATYSNLAPTGADPVVILSHAMWRDRFGSASDVVGKSLLLDRKPFTIVGVMPPGLELPEPGVRLWIPWSVAGDSARDQHFSGGLARLNRDVSIAQAEDQLNTVARDLGARYPDSNRGWGVRLSPLDVETVGETATVLWVLLAAVGLVLLVACANVALLSLMRGLDRADETTLRRALGASTGRLLREFLMESVLLAGGGGLLGLALATAGLRLLPSLTTDLPRLDEVSLDNRALLFIAALTILTAVFSGLPQAWRRTRASAIPASGGLAPWTTPSAQRHALRDGIVIAQVALAVVLLAGSTLLVRSYLHLRATDPGFDARGVLVAPVFLDRQAYNTQDKVRAYYRTLFERLAAIPGVTAVGGATTVPTSPLGPDFERPVWPEGIAADRAQQTPASVRTVTPGYFPAMKLRIADGRAFDDRDRPTSPRVIMVSETLARRLWPGQRAVGRQLVVDYSTAGTYPYEIVGVVGDTRFRGPRSEPLAEIYFPHAHHPYPVLNVVIRANGDPRAMIPAVRQALKEVDPQKPAHGLNALEDLMGATYARDRQTMVTLLAFALSAIFLAVLSVYGVLSQRVRERSREIAIRMALGADGSWLVTWVAGTGVRLVSVGIVAGFAIAWMLTGTIDRLLVGVRPTDPLTAFTVATVLIVVGLVATLIPSWRATRIDPVAVLRRG
jgi:predicted permease